MAKIIAVVGATGQQGGGLVRAILADPSHEFKVRAITRDVNSEKAKALAAQGAEVVAANIDSVEDLKAAFAGCYGAFCITNFWEHFSVDKEIQQARNQAEAAKAAGLKHVVWSTLEDTRKFMPLNDDSHCPTLHGKYKVPHFDGKGEANDLFLQFGVPTTFLLTTFYWDNIPAYSSLRKGEDGNYTISFPIADKKLSGIAVEDIGRSAFGIFKGGDKYLYKTVGLASDHFTGDEIAKVLSEELGVKATYSYIPPEIYRTLGFPGADDLTNMYIFYRDFADYFGGIRKIDEVRAINPTLQSFRQYVVENKAKFVL